MSSVEDDWCLEASDEENKNDEPEVEEIIELYNKLRDNEILEFEWKNPGRRLPDDDDENKDTNDEEIDNENNDDKNKEIDDEFPTEFDFDSFTSEPSDITPRRTPAPSKTPRTQKRVATMDKILGDIYRKKKEEEIPKSKSCLFESSGLPVVPLVPYIGSPSESTSSKHDDT